MDKEDIIKLAMEANIKQAIETQHLLLVHELERFAALVAAAEREACAKRLEGVGCDHCAANIRARGNA